MSTGYKITEQDKLHYLTIQVVYWIDVFTRQRYRDIILDSFVYCQQNKGLEIYAFVIMSNHIHLLVRADNNNNLSEVIRDFKKHTSKRIIDSINNEPECRKEWMLELFEHAAKKHKRNKTYQIWTHENHAELIDSNKFINEKLEYIHQNPVKAGIVESAEDYIYSSAVNYAGKKGLIDIEILTTEWITY